MEGFRLLGECDAASRYYSKAEKVDVLVICANGSRNLYINGEDETKPWMATAMSVKPLGASVSFSDYTPMEVRTGQWSDDLDDLDSPVKTMTVQDFLSLASVIKRTK